MSTNTLSHGIKVPAKNHYISDTAAHASLKGFAIYVVQQAVIDTITVGNSSIGTNSLDGETLPEKTFLYLDVTAVTLTSGSIMVYEGSA